MTLQNELFSLESKFALPVLEKRRELPEVIGASEPAQRRYNGITALKAALNLAGNLINRGSMRISAALCVMGVVAVAGLGGCAEMAAFGVNKDSDPAVKQKVVTERVMARWDALVKGNVEQAYTFFSAGSKATTPLEAYKAKIRPGRWREAKIDKVECQGEVCEVTVTITFDHPRMKGIQMPLTESWIIENRSAWYVYR